MSAADPRRVRFACAAGCSGAGFVSQSSAVPAFADGEPFALDIQGTQTLADEERGGITFLVGGACAGHGSIGSGKVYACLGVRA